MFSYHGLTPAIHPFQFATRVGGDRPAGRSTVPVLRFNSRPRVGGDHQPADPLPHMPDLWADDPDQCGDSVRPPAVQRGWEEAEDLLFLLSDVQERLVQAPFRRQGSRTPQSAGSWPSQGEEPAVLHSPRRAGKGESEGEILG